MYVYVCFIDCAQTQNHTYTNMISNTTYTQKVTNSNKEYLLSTGKD